MLIFLEPTVTETDRSLNRLLGLKELARTIRLGTHVVTGPPHTLKTLAKNPDLDQIDRDQFGWMASKCTDLAPLRDRISVYLTVGAGDAAPSKDRQGDKQIWRTGVGWLGAGESRATRSRLFVEASEDAEMYHILANALGSGDSLLRVPGLCAAFQPVSLGGGNAGTIWLQAKDGSPSLGVVDSERQHPRDGLGSTAIAAERAERALAADPSDGCPRQLVVLEAHEIENLLPDALLRSATKGEASIRALGRTVSSFDDLKELIAKDLLGQVLEHLRGLSAQKQREALAGACQRSDAALPGLLYAWGLTFRVEDSAGKRRSA